MKINNYDDDDGVDYDELETAPKRVRIPGALDFQVVTLAIAAARMKVQVLHEESLAAQKRKSKVVTLEFPHHSAAKLAARLISELRTTISGLIQSPPHFHRVKLPPLDKTLTSILSSLEEVMRGLVDRIESQFNVGRVRAQALIRETLANHLQAGATLKLHSKKQKARESIREIPLLAHEEHVATLLRMGLKS